VHDIGMSKEEECRYFHVRLTTVHDIGKSSTCEDFPNSKKNGKMV